MLISLIVKSFDESIFFRNDKANAVWALGDSSSAGDFERFDLPGDFYFGDLDPLDGGKADTSISPILVTRFLPVIFEMCLLKSEWSF